MFNSLLKTYAGSPGLIFIGTTGERDFLFFSAAPQFQQKQAMEAERTPHSPHVHVPFSPLPILTLAAWFILTHVIMSMN